MCLPEGDTAFVFQPLSQRLTRFTHDHIELGQLLAASAESICALVSAPLALYVLRVGTGATVGLGVATGGL